MHNGFPLPVVASLCTTCGETTLFRVPSPTSPTSPTCSAWRQGDGLGGDGICGDGLCGAIRAVVAVDDATGEETSPMGTVLTDARAPFGLFGAVRNRAVAMHHQLTGATLHVVCLLVVVRAAIASATSPTPAPRAAGSASGDIGATRGRLEGFRNIPPTRPIRRVAGPGATGSPGRTGRERAPGPGGRSSRPRC